MRRIDGRARYPARAARRVLAGSLPEGSSRLILTVADLH
jgi:hypothetical protein